MAIETIQIAGFIGVSDYTPSSLAIGFQDFRTSAFFTIGDDIIQLSFGVFLETDFLKMEKINDGNATCNIYVRNNPLDAWTLAGIVLTVSYNSFGLLFGIDNTLQKGSIYTCVAIPGGYYSIDSRSTFYQNDTNLIYNALLNSMPVPAITSNGGGATHIAKVTGQLSSLSNNLSDILMVSGGGGGGLLSGDTDYSGKEAGGISGSGDNSANQTTGYAFGQGESADGVSGGGGGLYGGYKGTSSKSGGAGSGYIGNSLVSNKKMVGYNVPTSEAESTKTESVNEASESPVSGKPKIGNGHARIKLVKQLYTLGDIAKANNLTNVQSIAGLNNISGLSQYFLTNNVLYTQEIDDTYANRMESFDGEEGVSSGKYGRRVSYQGGGYKYEQTGFMCYIPIQRTTITKLELKLKFDVFCGGSDTDTAKEWNFVKFGFGKVENGNMVSSGWVIETTYAQVKNTLSNYINLSISLSEPFTADYFVLLGYDGVFHFKDVLLFNN